MFWILNSCRQAGVEKQPGMSGGGVKNALTGTHAASVPPSSVNYRDLQRVDKQTRSEDRPVPALPPAAVTSLQGASGVATHGGEHVRRHGWEHGDITWPAPSS